MDGIEHMPTPDEFGLSHPASASGDHGERTVIGAVALPSVEGITHATDVDPIAICAGHSHVDQGAEGPHGLSEWSLCRPLASDIQCEMMAANLPWIDPLSDVRQLDYPDYLNDRVRRLNAIPISAAIDLHLNSGDMPKHHYVLCLHAPGDGAGHRLGECLARAFADTQAEWAPDERRPRTFVSTDTRWVREPRGFLRDIEAPSVIAEPAFLVWPPLLRAVHEDRDRWVRIMAKAYVRGIREWIEGK